VQFLGQNQFIRQSCRRPMSGLSGHVRFSNRPVWVKRQCCSRQVNSIGVRVGSTAAEMIDPFFRYRGATQRRLRVVRARSIHHGGRIGACKRAANYCHRQSPGGSRANVANLPELLPLRNENATSVSGRRQRRRPWAHSLSEPRPRVGLHGWEPCPWRSPSYYYTPC